MQPQNEIQKLLLDFIIDEGNYDLDKYSQNIEIISPMYDSFAYLLHDPRLLLLSNNVEIDQIKKYEYEVMALRGKLSLAGLIELTQDHLNIEDRIYRKGLIDCYLPEYPFLNDDASIIAYYDWSIDGMAQIFTMLDNASQDYFIGFGFNENDPKADEKRIVVEHFIKELREETSYTYDGSYEKCNDNELYMISKTKILSPKKNIYTF